MFALALQNWKLKIRQQKKAFLLFYSLKSGKNQNTQNTQYTIIFYQFIFCVIMETLQQFVILYLLCFTDIPMFICMFLSLCVLFTIYGLIIVIISLCMMFWSFDAKLLLGLLCFQYISFKPCLMVCWMIKDSLKNFLLVRLFHCIALYGTLNEFVIEEIRESREWGFISSWLSVIIIRLVNRYYFSFIIDFHLINISYFTINQRLSIRT